MSIANPDGHSATVDLQLHIDDQQFSLSQVGPDYCVLAKPKKLPRGRAEIVVVIDGHVQRTSVQLTETASDNQQRIVFRRLDAGP